MKNKHIWLIIAGVMGLSIIIGLVVWNQQTSNYMTKPEFMDKFHDIQEKWNKVVPVNLFYEALGHPDKITSYPHRTESYIFEYKVQDGIVKLRVHDVGKRLIEPDKYEDCFEVVSIDDMAKQNDRFLSGLYLLSPEASIPSWPQLTKEQYKQRIKQIEAEQRLERQRLEERLKREYGY